MSRTVAHYAFEQHGILYPPYFAGTLNHHPLEPLQNLEPLSTILPHFREKQQTLAAVLAVESRSNLFVGSNFHKLTRLEVKRLAIHERFVLMA
jgi:hypothetical protein